MQQTDLILTEQLDDYWAEIDFKPLEHQLEVADTVVNKLQGRALLADGVGLGKTIEAGLILTEYLLRGKIENCLILTPASLALQWWQELTEKFGLDVFNNRKGKGWHYFDIIISSLDRAKLAPHNQQIRERDFDMIIVDEAQKLKNKDTKNWSFVNSLTAEHILLLTATPLQNNLQELRNILSLLEPKLAEKEIKRERLKEELDKFMLRNSRTGLKTKSKTRKVKSLFITRDKKEVEIYQKIASLDLDKFLLTTLKRECCSSPLATIKTIDQLLQKDKLSQIKAEELIGQLAKITESQKVKRVKEIIKREEEKFIIFTHYKATQQYLAYHLRSLGYLTYLFNGSLSANKKERVKRSFKRDGDILISTEAGGEGINLQFCSRIINYDLTWNPMKLEQRVGRVHRLGQSDNVKVYNLITKDSIEERLATTLKKKINLFEEMVGELAEII